MPIWHTNSYVSWIRDRRIARRQAKRLWCAAACQATSSPVDGSCASASRPAPTSASTLGGHGGACALLRIASAWKYCAHTQEISTRRSTSILACSLRQTEEHLSTSKHTSATHVHPSTTVLTKKRVSNGWHNSERYRVEETILHINSGLENRLDSTTNEGNNLANSWTALVFMSEKWRIARMIVSEKWRIDCCVDACESENLEKSERLRWWKIDTPQFSLSHDIHSFTLGHRTRPRVLGMYSIDNSPKHWTH